MFTEYETRSEKRERNEEWCKRYDDTVIMESVNNVILKETETIKEALSSAVKKAKTDDCIEQIERLVDCVNGLYDEMTEAVGAINKKLESR